MVNRQFHNLSSLTGDDVKELIQNLLTENNSSNVLSFIQSFATDGDNEKSLYEILDKNCYESVLEFSYNNMKDFEFGLVAVLMASKFMIDENEEAYVVINGDEVDMIAKDYKSEELNHKIDIFSRNESEDIKYVRRKS